MFFQVPSLTVIYFFYLTHTFLSMMCFFPSKTKISRWMKFQGISVRSFWNIRFKVRRISIYSSPTSKKKNCHNIYKRNAKYLIKDLFLITSFILSVKIGGKKMGKFLSTLSVNMSSNRANSFSVAEKVPRALRETTKKTSPWLMGKL